MFFEFFGNLLCDTLEPFSRAEREVERKKEDKIRAMVREELRRQKDKEIVKGEK